MLTVGRASGHDQGPEQGPRDRRVAERVDGVREQGQRVAEQTADQLGEPEAQAHRDPPGGGPAPLAIKVLNVRHRVLDAHQAISLVYWISLPAQETESG